MSRVRAGQPVVDASDSDDAYFREIRSRLPESSQRVVEGLERVKSVYVECGRDHALQIAFDKFLENYLAKRDGRQDEANVFFLTGESGAGKSAAVTRLLRNSDLLKPMRRSFGTISPYVSIKLTGFTHPRLAGRRIVQASGYPIRRDMERGEVWDRMASLLRTRRVFLVHIDETQHLIKQKASQNEREELTNAIKGVSIDTDWPVAFLLSGLPRLTQLPLADEQFERRGHFVHFTDVAMPQERGLVVEILACMSKAADLDLGGLPETDLPERLAHAARYRYARICQVVLAAIHEALRAKKNTGVLLRRHFELAYVTHSQARGLSEMNPFVADAWEDLPAGSFLIDIEGDD